MAQEVIAIIDVETTGVNTDRDQVIEFAVQKGLEEGAFNKAWRVRPSIPIPAAATAIHGISNEDVRECPPFSAIADLVRKVFTGSSIIVGYNVEFDIKMLQSEFRRLRQPPLELSRIKVIDPLELWRRSEPRRLEDAVRRFVGGEHVGAHAASADVAATGKVLTGMMQAFGLADKNWDELSEYINPEKKNWIGPTHHFQWQNGIPVVGFGKYKGTPVASVAQTDESYLPWIISQDFSPHVKEIAQAVLAKEPGEFMVWIQQQYGR